MKNPLITILFLTLSGVAMGQTFRNDFLAEQKPMLSFKTYSTAEEAPDTVKPSYDVPPKDVRFIGTLTDTIYPIPDSLSLLPFGDLSFKWDTIEKRAPFDLMIPGEVYIFLGDEKSSVNIPLRLLQKYRKQILEILAKEKE